MTTTRSAFPSTTAGSGSTKRSRRLRALLSGDSPLAPAPRRPGGIPLWIGSWGSAAGLRRVARLGDGWLASAYNTSPDGFDAAREVAARSLSQRARDDVDVDHRRRAARRIACSERSSPRCSSATRTSLRDRLCIGPAEKCAELLSRYAEAGCERVYLWPLGDEPRQIELAATAVLPAVEA